MYGGGFEDEPPLLEELGINFEHILLKTKLVLNPLRSISQEVVNEADLAGPVVFICALGSMLLLSGKMHFGYIYGISVFANVMMWLLLVADRYSEHLCGHFQSAGHGGDGFERPGRSVVQLVQQQALLQRAVDEQPAAFGGLPLRHALRRLCPADRFLRRFINTDR